MNIKKRGRPAGSKSKAKPVTLAQVHKAAEVIAKSINPVNDFAQTLAAWDEMEKINWEEVAKKQETELKVLRDENDELARICVNRFEKINDYMKLVKYLEGRIEDITIRSR
jgi:hypothetical protein